MGKNHSKNKKSENLNLKRSFGINIIFPSGNEEFMEINPKIRLEELRISLIKNDEFKGINEKQIVLYNCGRLCYDIYKSETLESLGIENGFSLEIKILQPKDIRLGMHIYIKTLLSKKIILSVESSNTIKNIKEKIQEKEGILVNQQRLIYAGQQLDDDKMLMDYNIQAGIIIHLILSLCGS